MRKIAMVLLVAAAVNFAPTDYVWVPGYGWVRPNRVADIQSPGSSGGASSAESGGANGGGSGGSGHSSGHGH